MNSIIATWFSCGITSAVATKLSLDKYPNVEIYYMEIDSAHPDNERFISDCEKWFGRKINRLRSRKYKDQFEVIEKTGYVNGADGARCTLELKKEVRFKLEEEMRPNLFEPNKPVISNQVFGFEFTAKEINRAIEFKIDFSYTNPLFPLIEERLTKEDCHALIEKVGIEAPEMYKLGYNNNNCIGCVKGGMGYWNKIRVDFPVHFAKMAKAERIAKHSCIKDTFLDELDPEQGREVKPIIPSCGITCEGAFENFKDSRTEKILSGEMSIYEIDSFTNRIAV